MQDQTPLGCSVSMSHCLNEKFIEGWVARRGPVQWSPASPDLSVYRYLKPYVYATKNEVRIEQDLSDTSRIENGLI